MATWAAEAAAVIGTVYVAVHVGAGAVYVGALHVGAVGTVYSGAVYT
jgi:hypothetical protein